MSFASGYAFQTNGQIGSQYTATKVNVSNVILSPGDISVNHIASFSSLPIGIYMIKGKFNSTIVSSGTSYLSGFSLNQADGVGYQYIDFSSGNSYNSAVYTSFIGTAITLNNINFIINVTNSSPIYLLATVLLSSGGSGGTLSIPSNQTTCVAIKLA
nr:MAG: hypothetical protein [Lake Baikal virophage 14]